MTSVPSIVQNLLGRRALSIPRPFRPQKIAQRVREGPLHEDVGRLIGTGMSTEKGGEVSVSRSRQQVGIQLRMAPKLTPTFAAYALPAQILSKCTTDAARFSLFNRCTYLARRIGSLPSS